jgi:hypothetical protein
VITVCELKKKIPELVSFYKLLLSPSDVTKHPVSETWDNGMIIENESECSSWGICSLTFGIYDFYDSLLL